MRASEWFLFSSNNCQRRYNLYLLSHVEYADPTRALGHVNTNIINIPSRVYVMANLMTPLPLLSMQRSASVVDEPQNNARKCGTKTSHSLTFLSFSAAPLRTVPGTIQMYTMRLNALQFKCRCKQTVKNIRQQMRNGHQNLYSKSSLYEINNMLFNRCKD